MACDMPEPCKFQSLDSCQKRFPWTHKGVDLAPHPVVGLVLQVGDAEKFPQALGFRQSSAYRLTASLGAEMRADCYSARLFHGRPILIFNGFVPKWKKYAGVTYMIRIIGLWSQNQNRYQCRRSHGVYETHITGGIKQITL